MKKARLILREITKVQITLRVMQAGAKRYRVSFPQAIKTVWVSRPFCLTTQKAKTRKKAKKTQKFLSPRFQMCCGPSLATNLISWRAQCTTIRQKWPTSTWTPSWEQLSLSIHSLHCMKLTLNLALLPKRVAIPSTVSLIHSLKTQW